MSLLYKQIQDKKKTLTLTYNMFVARISGYLLIDLFPDNNDVNMLMKLMMESDKFDEFIDLDKRPVD